MNAAPVEHEVRKLDVVLLALAFVITTIGILLVFDASYAFALFHAAAQTKYVAQQSVWAVIGIAAMLGLSRFPYWKLRRGAAVGLLGCMIAMILVFVPHIGITVHASHRWIGHGALRVQPSEFAKFFIVLFIARSCAGNVRIMKHFVTGPGPGVAATIILAMLTAKEPDLGTALLITFTGAAALFFAGMKWKHMLAMMAVTLTLVGGVLLVKFEHAKTSNDQAGSYQISRILVFLHPETDIQGFGYQVYHSMMGIGSGGLTGRGIGEGREKLNLPEAHTDFIFEVVGEEFGLLGTLTTLGILFIIVARGMHIACTTRDRFGSLLAAGLSFSLGIQAAVNIGVATGAIPNTGVPLPFVSYGGSSLLMSLVMVGILLNIGKNPDGDPNIVRVQPNQRLDRDFSRRWQTNGALPRRQPNAEQNPYCKPAAG